jgi:hypothetical protein
VLPFVNPRADISMGSSSDGRRRLSSVIQMMERSLKSISMMIEGSGDGARGEWGAEEDVYVGRRRSAEECGQPTDSRPVWF